MPYYKNRQNRELFYALEGTNEKPILFLHGYLGSSKAHWHHQLSNSVLQQNFKMIAPDYRGFGKSNTINTKWGEVHYSSDIIKDLEDLIQELSLIKAPVLVGYSMGAALALEFGKKNPISGLILLSPRPFLYQKNRSLPFLSKEKRSSSKVRGFFWGIIKKFTKSRTKRSLQKKSKNKHLIEGFKLLANIPTCIVYGLNDTVTPQLAFDILKNNMPHAEIKEFPGDHGINHENPDEFNKLILDFSSSIEFKLV